MSWVTEVRAAVEGLSLDVVEMSEAAVVKFEEVWVYFRSDRSVDTRTMHLPGVLREGERAALDAVVSQLDRRVWRFALSGDSSKPWHDQLSEKHHLHNDLAVEALLDLHSRLVQLEAHAPTSAEPTARPEATKLQELRALRITHSVIRDNGRRAEVELSVSGDVTAIDTVRIGKHRYTRVE
jgi:hypothetical protein